MQAGERRLVIKRQAFAETFQRLVQLAVLFVELAEQVVRFREARILFDELLQKRDCLVALTDGEVAPHEFFGGFRKRRIVGVRFQFDDFEVEPDRVLQLPRHDVIISGLAERERIPACGGNGFFKRGVQLFHRLRLERGLLVLEKKPHVKIRELQPERRVVVRKSGGAVEDLLGVFRVVRADVKLIDGDVGGEIVRGEVDRLVGELQRHLGLFQELRVKLREVEARLRVVRRVFGRVLENTHRLRGVAAPREFDRNLDGEGAVARIKRERVLVGL